MKKSIKYTLSITLILLFFIILVVIFLFKNIEVSSVLPPRPQSIPISALWIGGPDGGVYVLVKNNNDGPDIYDAEIYYSEGSISYKGKLVINTADSPQFNYNDTNSYSAWDGDTLYLQDGRLLTIVSE
jgi:hypothetical protein